VHPFEQAVPAGENRGKDLLDDVGLPDDDLLELFLHQLSMLAELLKDISEASRLGGRQRKGPGGRGADSIACTDWCIAKERDHGGFRNARATTIL
jgi:hypothetical protein